MYWLLINVFIVTGSTLRFISKSIVNFAAFSQQYNDLMYKAFFCHNSSGNVPFVEYGVALEKGKDNCLILGREKTFFSSRKCRTDRLWLTHAPIQRG